MEKTAFDLGVETAMEKVALSPEKGSEAYARRMIRAYREGGGKMRTGMLGIPTPGNIKGMINQFKTLTGSKGKTHMVHMVRKGQSAKGLAKGILKETLKR